MSDYLSTAGNTGARTRAFVYPDGSGYSVLYAHDGIPYDEADGFDDEIEAVEAACRGVYGIGTVHVGRGPFDGRDYE